MTSRQANLSAARPRSAGLTLVEMLVSVAILAVMILAFSTILSTSQSVVTNAQKLMRSNAQASAVGKVVRPDLRRASQQGFLAILDPGSAGADGSPMLVFTAPGLIDSMQSDEAASTAITVYSLRLNGGDSDLPRILCRQNWLAGGTGTGDQRDNWPTTFGRTPAWIHTLPRDLVYDAIVKQAEDNLPDLQLPVPANSPKGLQRLWQSLSSHCVALGVLWTDGQVQDDQLQWYGIDYVMNAGQPKYIRRAADSGWTGQMTMTSLGASEFNVGSASAPQYMAMWTHHNPENWPKAIKLRFTLLSPTAAQSAQAGAGGAMSTEALDYEIICPLGR